MSPSDRCDRGSKRRMLSISSPNRSIRTGAAAPAGEQVDQAAAECVFAGFEHRADTSIPVVGEVRGKRAGNQGAAAPYVQVPPSPAPRAAEPSAPGR